MLFDHESREAIKRLKALALKEAIIDRQIIDALAPGENNRVISPEKIKKLLASDDFQAIIDQISKTNFSFYPHKIYFFENQICDCHRLKPNDVCYLGSSFKTDFTHFFRAFHQFFMAIALSFETLTPMTQNQRISHWLLIAGTPKNTGEIHANYV